MRILSVEKMISLMGIRNKRKPEKPINAKMIPKKSVANPEKYRNKQKKPESIPPIMVINNLGSYFALNIISFSI
jgi:hypothetical protein